MFTFRKALVAFTALAASFAVASPATAYVPGTDVQLTINLGSDRMTGGKVLTASIDATSGGQGVPGTITVSARAGFEADSTPSGFDHLPLSRHTNSGQIKLKFKTHVVTSIKVFPVTARFVPDDAASAAAGAQSTTTVNAFYSTKTAAQTLPMAFRSASTTRNETLLPLGSGNDNGTGTGNGNGNLPNTGGINVWYLIIGALLLAAGSGILTVTRRRSKNSF